eukprot:15528476-Heterocapsa_arctica.AAC.1
MEEDEQEDVLPVDWSRQRAEDSFVLAHQDVYLTTDMPTMLKVEDLMITKERRVCVQHRLVRSDCGQ